MSQERRKQIISMIDQARAEGARIKPACQCAEIDAATYRRWQHDGQVLSDRRAKARRPAPCNRLNVEERQRILITCHLLLFQSLLPSQIVPTLADLGCYRVSESTFYRVLREADQQHDRGRTKPRQKRAKPAEFRATSPN